MAAFRISQLASHLIVRQLLALVGTHEAVHAEEVDVPLVWILLQLPDLEPELSTGALDAGDDGVAGGVGRSLTTIEQLLGIVLIAGKFFDLVFEQRRDNSRRDEVQENGESQKTRQGWRETHVRRSVKDRMLPESERGAGKELGLDAESGGRSGGRRDTQARKVAGARMKLRGEMESDV